MRNEDERVLILHYYRIVLQAPPKSAWGGRDGTFALIRKALNFKLNRLNKIKKIVAETYESHENDRRYDSTYIIRGRKESIIQPGSHEESNIADFMEDGVSLRDVTRILNEPLLQDCGGILENSHWFTKSAIEGAFNCMKKIEVPMIKRAQGSEDRTCNWAQARHRFIAQMQVCMHDEPDLSKFINANGDIPGSFLLENLIAIDFNGTAFWDEAHRQCLVGDGRNEDSTQFKFPRNENGKYNECGAVSDETAFFAHLNLIRKFDLP